MRKITLRKALTMLGARNIKRSRIYNCMGKEYHYFFNGSEGKFFSSEWYNLFYQECPTAGLPKVMYRTCKDDKDYTGGINQWGFCKKLESMGFYL